MEQDSQHESFEPNTSQTKGFPDDLQSTFGVASLCLANFHIFLTNHAKLLRFNGLSHCLSSGDSTLQEDLCTPVKSC